MNNLVKKQESLSQLAAGTASHVHIGTHGGCDFYAYEKLAQVADFWRRLEGNATYSPFQSLVWIRSVVAAEVQATPNSLLQHVFIVGFAGGDPVVILPFSIRRGTFGQRLTWLGDKMSDYNGMIADRDYAASLPQDIVCQVVTMLRTAFPAIDAANLIRNPVGLFIGIQPSEPNAIEVAAEFNSHSVTLQSDWTALYARLRSGKSKQRLRSKYRSLAKLGDVCFRQVRGKTDRKALACKALDWKSQQLQASGRRDPFGTKTAPTAVRSAIEAAVAANDGNSLKVFGLFLNGKPVAGMLAFVNGGTFYYFVSAYTPRLDGKYSIGVQLLVKTLELASRSGLERYDFLIGDESYKTAWCDREIRLVNYVRPFTLRGRLMCAGQELRLECKKLVLNNEKLKNLARLVLKVRRKPIGTDGTPKTESTLQSAGAKPVALWPQFATALSKLKTLEDA